LTIKAKASGDISTFEYSGNIYVDATEASGSFGFAGYHTSVSAPYYDVSVSKDIFYGPVYGAKDAYGKAYTQYSAGSETVYIPVNSSVPSAYPNSWLFFTADDVHITGNSGYSYYGERAIKAWNETAGVSADDSKAASAWLSAVDGTDGVASQYSY